MKICTKCGLEKSLTDFFKDRRSRTGASPSCKQCVKDYKEGRWKHLKDVPSTIKEKDCAKCKKSKLIEEFSRDRNHPSGRNSYCRDCNKDIRDRRKDQAMIYHRNKVYGVTESEYEQLLINQGYKCAIKKSYSHNPNEKMGCLAVDHCHNCKEIRGLLSGVINRAIGLFGENPSLLRRAADYLEAHNCKE